LSKNHDEETVPSVYILVGLYSVYSKCMRYFLLLLEGGGVPERFGGEGSVVPERLTNTAFEWMYIKLESDPYLIAVSEFENAELLEKNTI
jgi:hypothetical protein